MNITIYYNSAIGSCLVILLIAIDYLRHFTTDYYQKKLLIAAIFSLFAAIVFDFAGYLLSGRTEFLSIVMTVVMSLKLIARNFCFYIGMVFIDYFTHGSIDRSKRISFAVGAFLVIYTASVVFNVSFGYYFTITSNNDFLPGNYYYHQLFLSFIPMLITIFDILFAPKRFKKDHGTFMIVFIFIIIFGAALDISFGETNYIWPCVSAAMLYIYFFIIKTNAKIDRLTGIGNRHSCNEFIDILSRKSVKENYTVAILELCRIREINHTLGHLEGDNALHDIATIIKGSVRKMDFVGRYDGDEFLVVTSTKDNIQRLIDRIEETITAQNNLRVRPYLLNFSFGYDIFTTNSGQSIMDFIEHVEALMFKCRDVREKEFPSAITS
jgi:diguanylate cyclase (GGDEF)-like protein